MGFIRARAEEVKTLTIPNLAVPVIPPDVAQLMSPDAGGGQNDHEATIAQLAKGVV